jgi:hypothetical protein
VQNAMHKHYNYIEKNDIFEDPWGRIATYFKTIQKIAPELLCNTYQYKDELLSILVSTTFEKNYCTDMDVEYLLCNATIEEYIDILDDVYRIYKQGLIDLQRFNSFLFQNFHVSNSVVKNYQNEKLIVFFNMVLQDEELINLYPEGTTASIKEFIISLLNGTRWDGKAGWGFGRKWLNENQPPVLDELQIDCP